MRATRLIVLCVLVGVIFAAAARDAQAQRRRGRIGIQQPPELGVRAGYDFKTDYFSLGGQLRVPAGRFALLLSGDSYIEPGTNPYQLNADLVLLLRELHPLYAGGGIAFYHSGTTDTGPNIVVGLSPRRRAGSAIHPYAEGRWTFLDTATPFRFVFGVNLVLGR